MLITTALETEEKLARYRAAVVVLLELLKRNSGEYRSWNDQELIREVQALVDRDGI